ncbi:MAG: DegT/DnrJ/EryC1/StrS family aminotransferase [Nitrospirales bacterium]
MNITSPKFDDHEIQLVKQCLASGWVTQGPFVQEFEKLFASRHQVTHALATTSCTAALHLACMALRLKPGDEVVVPAFTWVTSAHCVEYMGAKVVFAEVEAETFNIDPKALEAALTPNTRAVVVVHLFGLAAKMQEIMAITRERGVAVIEDAACAVGASYQGRPVGGFGEFGCFSFHPRKVITTGEGGMVTTNLADLAAKVRSLRNHGATGHPEGDPTVGKPYGMGTFDMLGHNLRLSDVQGSIGVAQMSKLDALLAERKGLAKRYDDLLAGVEELRTPAVPEKCGHTYQSYVVRVAQGGMAKRNAIMELLAAQNIQTRPGTHAVHRLGYYAKKYNLRAEDFPISAACEDTTITLPLFPGMTDEDQQCVVEALRAACRA